MIIDMHTHAGSVSPALPFNRACLESMAPAGVAAAVVAAVADAPIIRRNPATRLLEHWREPAAGECWAATEAHLAAWEASGWRIAREPAEISAADPAIVLAVEGGDFLEDDLERLDALAARGVRSLQIVHYVPNDLGDIQTAPPRHDGLTALGAAAVRRLEKLGVIVDLAHCSEATALGVARVAGKPLLCSHANLAWPDRPDGGHLRFLSPDYARLVAESGGVVGAWIGVLHAEGFAGLVEHLFRLIDAIGVEHVGIGTDMPVGAAVREMPDFSRHPDLAAAMRARGMTAGEVEAVCSGNWLRVFRAARGR